MRVLACKIFFKQSRSWEGFRLRNLLILDYGITTMYHVLALTLHLLVKLAPCMIIKSILLGRNKRVIK